MNTPKSPIKLRNYNVLKNEQHPFHLVDRSPWPFFTAIAVLQLVVGLVFFMHNYVGSAAAMSLGCLLTIVCLYRWFSDVVCESTYQGNHTSKVKQGLRLGMKLFIVSEIMFFFAFFWAFFHVALSPTIWIWCIWPPLGIPTINAFGLPLFNTVILLSSGISLTWAHNGFFSADRATIIRGLAITIILGILFTFCQLFEYIYSNFSLRDSVYGSIFYMATGFHGFHVIVGTIFLLVCLVRQLRYHFLRAQHFGFEAAAWYWHFVDVVWIFLWFWVYIWGGV